MGTLVTAVCPGEVPDAVHLTLHSLEREYAAKLQGDRRREWLAGRHCLAAALGACPSREPILTAPSGAPLLAAGIVGSISHKGPLSVGLAAVGCQGVGVDVECAEEGDIRLSQKVLNSDELRVLETISEESVALLFVVLHFAVKEAVYKSFDPPVQEELDFDQIQLCLDPHDLGRQAEWLPVPVRLRSESANVTASILLDGKWLLAVCKRD